MTEIKNRDMVLGLGVSGQYILTRNEMTGPYGHTKRRYFIIQKIKGGIG